MAKPLLNREALEKSEIVANAAMNRQRNLSGGNSYEKELGINPVSFLSQRLRSHRTASWLDLCCGTGRALIQAANEVAKRKLSGKLKLVGVDLVPMFESIPEGFDGLQLIAASVGSGLPTQRFDLITCVHGLHYVGDKLGFLQKAVARLKPGGLFLAHLDFDNLILTDSNSARAYFLKNLRVRGFRYQPKRHLLSCSGLKGNHMRYRYIGADCEAGPNYTGQPAVNSHYQKTFC